VTDELGRSLEGTSLHHRWVAGTLRVIYRLTVVLLLLYIAFVVTIDHFDFHDLRAQQDAQLACNAKYGDCTLLYRDNWIFFGHDLVFATAAGERCYMTYPTGFTMGNREGGMC